MTDTDRGGTSADEAMQELDGEWGRLAEGLATYLRTMRGEDDRLMVEVPYPDENPVCPPYAQFAGLEDGRLMAEISGNAHLLPQYRLGADGCAFLSGAGWLGNDESEENWCRDFDTDEAEIIAGQVVWALRRWFGLAHPQLLTQRAWGPAGDSVGVLGLCATAEVPADISHTTAAPQAALALEPAGRHDLLRIVANVLREKYESEPVLDEDGDFVLQHLGQPVWVRVRGDQPAVEIVARVAHDVYSRRRTAVEIGLLNRDSVWVQWVLVERMVWQRLMLPGLPFVPAHLDAMLDGFLEVMTSTRDDLAYRVGAKVA